MIVAVRTNGCQNSKDWQMLAVVTMELRTPSLKTMLWELRMQMIVRELRLRMLYLTEFKGKGQRKTADMSGKLKTTSLREICLLF